MSKSRPFGTAAASALAGASPSRYNPAQRLIAAEWVARQSVKDNLAHVNAFRAKYKNASPSERKELIAAMYITADGVRAIAFPSTLIRSALTKPGVVKMNAPAVRSNPAPKKRKAAVKKESEEEDYSGPDTPADKVKQARVKLLFNFPFFGFLVSNLQDVMQPGLKTAATDGKSVFWDPEFVKKLSLDDLMFVAAHEAMHCALQHLWRRDKRSMDQAAFNAAADYVVNDILLEGGFRAPSIPFLHGVAKGRSMEAVYDDLIKGGGKDKEEGEGGNSGGTLDDHRPWKEADKDAGGEGSSDFWKANIASARNFGKAPGGVARHVEEILYPKANWRVLLREGMYFPVDYSWQHIDRRLTHLGVMLPTLHGEQHRVVVAIDTSGSMSGDQLSEAWAEIVSIARETDIDIRVLAADTEVTKEWRADNFGTHMIKEIMGGGGTDFRPVFKRVEEYADDGWFPELVIYFTDLDGAFPNNTPDCRVIWAVTKRDEDKKAPFGEVIPIE